MQLPKIYCFTGTCANKLTGATGTIFYALNKGENSGKPLRESCSNCYIVESPTAELNNYFYWLSWGLWQSKQFHPLLKGSVIPFITIDDYRHTLTDAARLGLDSNLFQKTISTMQDIEKYESASRERLRLLGQAKIQIFRKVLTV